MVGVCFIDGKCCREYDQFHANSKNNNDNNNNNLQRGGGRGKTLLARAQHVANFSNAIRYFVPFEMCAFTMKHNIVWFVQEWRAIAHDK